MNEIEVFNALKYRTYEVKNRRYVWRNSAGQIHRDGGPAIEYDNGNKEWYQNDELHRKDGPAFEYNDGDKMWCQNGELHRTDGPAIEYYDGDTEWFIDGKRYTKDEFERIIQQ